MAPSDLVVTDQMDRVVGSTEPTRAPRIDVSAEGIKTAVAALLQRVAVAGQPDMHFPQTLGLKRKRPALTLRNGQRRPHIVAMR